MSSYIVYREQIPGLLTEWVKEYEVFVPTGLGEGLYDFVPWREGVEIAWNYDTAYNTLKRFFFPPREDLIRFNLEQTSAQPVVDSSKRLFLGVHPYDLKALNQLDQLLEGGSPDVNFRARRDAAAIFALEPMAVAKTAFWASMGAATVDLGYDLFWTAISPAAFYVKVGSPKGEALLKIKGKPQVATPAEREAARQAHLKIVGQAKRQGLKFPWKETPKVMAKSYDSPLWKEKAKLCLSCGSCNMVCPTCYCFDIQEEAGDTLKDGRRYRQWDGCMLNDFGLIAGGLNFRDKAWQRYRHRYMRKGKYIFDKIGELGCVGCGRCVRACTANIANPMAIFNQLWEALHHDA